MLRQDYLLLRQSVEAEVAIAINEQHDSKDLVNNIMRLFLHSISGAEVKRQRLIKQFDSFDRKSLKKPPSWALSNPGLSNRIPTMKEAK